MRMTPDAPESIRCAVSTCSCASFKPGGVQLRTCDHCGHNWVAHALGKLQAQPPSNCGPVEVALPGLVFDLSSLILYGAEAVPVQLKILLDRLYSILTPEQVGQILHMLSWSLSDYVRGYKLQSSGNVLDQWLMVTPEEQLLILKQFLRFGETRPIVELMMLQCVSAEDPKNCCSNIHTLNEQSTGSPGAFRNARGDSWLLADSSHFETPTDPNQKGPVHPFEGFPGGPSLLLPFHYSGSTIHCMVHPTKNLPPSNKVAQYQPKPIGTKLTEGRNQHGGRGMKQANSELSYKIKPDPDKPFLDRSLWRQNHLIQKDFKVLEVQSVLHKQETTSSFPPIKSTLSPSSFYPSISSSSPTASSSPLKPIQKWKGSSSSSIHSLPPISSSFLCPLPSLSTSSSLLPLPPTLCSLSSSTSAGSRKGRVCCGVCGKSFYDKGTLKIHYNAVHLKIKHRCTVAGCTMVFSSLRSRNRHSANPNPRLHTSTSRDCYRNSHSDSYTVMQTHKDTCVHKHTHDTASNMCSDIQEERETHNRHWQQNVDTAQQHMGRINTVGKGLSTPIILTHCHPRDTPPPAHSSPASLHSVHQSPTTATYFNASFRTSQQAPHPLSFLPADMTPPLVSPASFTSPGDVPPKQSLHLLSLHPDQRSPQSPPGHSPNFTEISANQEMGDNDTTKRDICTTSLKSQKNMCESRDTVPKKKPRKSSMPVKIEKKKMDGREKEEEEFF